MKRDIKNKIQEAFELPAEMLYGTYRLTAVGNNRLTLENYKSIVEYEANIIRFSNGICIIGEKLNVTEITADEIIIGGTIKNIEFEK